MKIEKLTSDIMECAVFEDLYFLLLAGDALSFPGSTFLALSFKTAGFADEEYGTRLGGRGKGALQDMMGAGEWRTGANGEWCEGAGECAGGLDAGEQD